MLSERLRQKRLANKEPDSATLVHDVEVLINFAKEEKIYTFDELDALRTHAHELRTKIDEGGGDDDAKQQLLELWFELSEKTLAVFARNADAGHAKEETAPPKETNFDAPPSTREAPEPIFPGNELSSAQYPQVAEQIGLRLGLIREQSLLPDEELEKLEQRASQLLAQIDKGGEGAGRAKHSLWMLWHSLAYQKLARPGSVTAVNEGSQKRPVTKAGKKRATGSWPPVWATEEILKDRPYMRPENRISTADRSHREKEVGQEAEQETSPNLDLPANDWLQEQIGFFAAYLLENAHPEEASRTREELNRHIERAAELVKKGEGDSKAKDELRKIYSNLKKPVDEILAIKSRRARRTPSPELKARLEDMVPMNPSHEAALAEARERIVANRGPVRTFKEQYSDKQVRIELAALAQQGVPKEVLNAFEARLALLRSDYNTRPEGSEKRLARKGLDDLDDQIAELIIEHYDADLATNLKTLKVFTKRGAMPEEEYDDIKTRIRISLGDYRTRPEGPEKESAREALDELHSEITSLLAGDISPDRLKSRRSRAGTARGRISGRIPEATPEYHFTKFDTDIAVLMKNKDKRVVEAAKSLVAERAALEQDVAKGIYVGDVKWDAQLLTRNAAGLVRFGIPARGPDPIFLKDGVYLPKRKVKDGWEFVIPVSELRSDVPPLNREKHFRVYSVAGTLPQAIKDLNENILRRHEIKDSDGKITSHEPQIENPGSFVDPEEEEEQARKADQIPLLTRIGNRVWNFFTNLS